MGPIAVNLRYTNMSLKKLVKKKDSVQSWKLMVVGEENVGYVTRPRSDSLFILVFL